MECPDQKQLGDYLLGVLPLEQIVLLEQHLRGCRLCADDPSSQTAIASMERSAPPVVRPTPSASWTGNATDVTADAGPPWPRDVPRLGSRYAVVDRIGRGGMGEVYRARDRTLGRDVALKIIRPEHAAFPSALEQFKREVALASAITHPNVLRVYDLGEHDGVLFLSMQMVEGDNLASVMRRAVRLPVARALALFRQVCEGVGAAHACGVLHRDLKPQNVLVDAQDHVYVADFGLARPLDGPPSGLGHVVGTPAYMSPEQVRGVELDARSDVYALGVLLFELLTGRVPFRAPTSQATMELRLFQTAPPVRSLATHVPVGVASVVARCLQPEPAERYATVPDLLADLDAPRAPSRAAFGPWVAAGAVALASAAAAGAWVAVHGRAQPATPLAAPPPVASANAPSPSATVLGPWPLPGPDTRTAPLVASDLHHVDIQDATRQGVALAQSLHPQAALLTLGANDMTEGTIDATLPMPGLMLTFGYPVPDRPTHFLSVLVAKGNVVSTAWPSAPRSRPIELTCSPRDLWQSAVAHGFPAGEANMLFTGVLAKGPPPIAVSDSDAVAYFRSDTCAFERLVWIR